MNIAICDDEELFQTQILDYIKQYALENKRQDIHVTVFHHGANLFDTACKIGGFDIYLLDILMSGINGIELGLQLRQAGHQGKIIYLTSSAEYAIDSYKVKAFDYLLKPFDQHKFFCTFDEAVKSLSAKEDKNLIIKTKSSSIRLSFDSILYAELSRRSIVYHLSNGKTVDSISIRTTFPEATQELLKDKRFVLCGASMVANLQHITMVESEAIIFQDMFKTYLGKKACRELRSVWYDYWFNKEKKE